MSNNWQNWQDLPCAERPRCISLFPSGLMYFRAWRTLRWFLLLALPSLCGCGAMYIRGRGLVAAFCLAVLGVAVTTVLFVTLCSGMSSSNWGTFYRRREPVRFWLAVAWLGLFYLVLAFAGYVG